MLPRNPSATPLSSGGVQMQHAVRRSCTSHLPKLCSQTVAGATGLVRYTHVFFATLMTLRPGFLGSRCVQDRKYNPREVIGIICTEYKYLVLYLKIRSRTSGNHSPIQAGVIKACAEELTFFVKRLEGRLSVRRPQGGVSARQSRKISISVGHIGQQRRCKRCQ